jgi:predicted porin
MKKSLLALAALTAFAGAASAQSSVTLFGIIDQSINYTKNGSVHETTMESNQLSSNRLGFRGVEDLGGGLKAGFWLEGGMSNENGNAGGLTFTRRSTVSLMGDFGEIRLGRDYVPTFWNEAFDDVYGCNGFGKLCNLSLDTLGSGATTGVRDNNVLSYLTPSLGGFYGQVSGALGEGVNGQKYAGIRLGYGAGPIDVNFAYATTKINGSDDYKVANAGGSYNFGAAKIYAVWNENKWGGAKSDTYGLSVAVPFGASRISASFAHNKGTGTNPAAKSYDGYKADMIGVEYTYSLSKRTTVYTQYGNIKNKGGAGYKIGTSATGSAVGDTSEGFGVGVRHTF